MGYGEYTKKMRNRDVIYNITWSDYLVGTKFNILQKTTEMTGLYVVFFRNKYNRLTPCIVGAAWYTGLRPSLLKLFNRLSIDVLPAHIFTKLQNEKIFIKYIEVYELVDLTEMLYSIKEKYPQAFFDTNGLPPPEHPNFVKTIDINTKIYYKQKKDTDI